MKRLNRPPRLHAYIRALFLALAMIAGALLVGVLGYRHLNDETWLDALVDAAMILAGMGPVTVLHGTAAKLFASFYALFSGIFLIGTAAVLLTPWLHHILHKLHADDPKLK